MCVRIVNESSSTLLRKYKLERSTIILLANYSPSNHYVNYKYFMQV